MTEEKFTELVNLYLDKEISQTELSSLKAELARNIRRKEEFAERCRLHQAMRMALDPESAKSARSRRRAPASGRKIQRQSSHSRSRSRAKALKPVGLSTRVDERVDVVHRGAGIPRWILGSGLAASLLVGFLVIPKIFQEEAAELTGVVAEGLVETDPLDEIGRKELLRFASNQEQRTVNRRASLAAKFRLMGLQPELTPPEKRLRSVSLATLESKRSQPSQAELLEKVKNFSPIPEPRILSHDSNVMDSTPAWPTGFQSSLATFKFE
jgi:hypothetical protein